MDISLPRHVYTVYSDPFCNITHLINGHVSALINTAISGRILITNSSKKKLRKLACKRVIQLINEYTIEIKKKTQICNIRSFVSSEITSEHNIPFKLIIKCSIIWLIKNTKTQCDEQMIVDFIIEFIFNIDGMKLIDVYDKITKIYDSDLYEVNDRAIMSYKIPKDLIQFI